MTPDTLEFAVNFPIVVTELVKRSSKLPFNYFTHETSHYEVVQESLTPEQIPRIPRRPETHITDGDKKLLVDYTKLYLQGVRQLSIRQQNTKSKSGTLPLYMYKKGIPAEQPVLNFKGLLQGTTTLCDDHVHLPVSPLLFRQVV